MGTIEIVNKYNVVLSCLIMIVITLLLVVIFNVGNTSSGMTEQIYINDNGVRFICSFAYSIINNIDYFVFPISNIKQIDIVNKTPIFLFDKYDIKYQYLGKYSAYYRWDEGIYLDRKMPVNLRDYMIREELCHALQPKPLNIFELRLHEIDCGHIQN